MPRPIRLQRGVMQLLVAFAILALLASFSLLRANTDPNVVAVVNGQEITRDTFYESLERYIVDGETLGQIVLRQLISEALVSQANSGLALRVTDEMVDKEFNEIKAYYGADFEMLLQHAGLTSERLREEVRLSLILDQLLMKDVTVSDDDVRAFFEENKEYFFQPELYQPSFIFVRTKEEADALLEKLAKGASFETLREENSLDKSNWGLVSQYDAIPPAIGDILFSLQVGEVSQPIALQGGFYLIRLDEIVPAREETFEDVADEIREHLLMSLAPSVDDVVGSLWKGANVNVNWDRYASLEADTR